MSSINQSSSTINQKATTIVLVVVDKSKIPFYYADTSCSAAVVALKMGRRTFSQFIRVIAFILMTFTSTRAYRIGDVIDVSVRTDYSTNDALRNQMPTFGRSHTVHFPETPSRFSLVFEEGLRPLPWVDGRNLESLHITFIYSKSGDGYIHAVSSSPKYGGSVADGFKVEYKWVEERELDPRMGAVVMFLCTFVAAVAILVSACGVIMGEEDGGQDLNGNSKRSSSHRAQNTNLQLGVPKWD